MSQHQKLVVIFIVLVAAALGIAEIAARVGSTYPWFAILKQGALPYLVGFFFSLFIIVPLGEWWMRCGETNGGDRGPH